jgi:hypothetical protein
VQVRGLAKLLDAKWVDASFSEKDGRPGGVNFEEWRARKKEIGGGQEQNVFEMRCKAWKSPNVS